KNHLSETATTREEISQRYAARIFCEKGAGSALLPTSFPLPPLPQKESEGARDAGVAKDPRTLAPRGTKATRPRTGPTRMTPGLTAPKSCRRKSAVSPASRARCLIGLLRMAPGGLTFQAPSPFLIA